MKFSKWHFAVRTGVCALFGVVLALAGVDAFTWRGAAVYGVWALLLAVDGLHEVCAVRRAYQAGRDDVVSGLLRSGRRV